MKNKLASRTALALTRPAGALVFDLLRDFPAFSASVCQDLGRWCDRRIGTLRARCISFQRAVDNAWSYLSLQFELHHTGTASASLRAEILSYLFFLLLISATFLI